MPGLQTNGNLPIALGAGVPRKALHYKTMRGATDCPCVGLLKNSRLPHILGKGRLLSQFIRFHSAT